MVQLSKAEHLLLGHHLKPGSKSMVTYSRGAYTSLAGKVSAMFRTMQDDRFQPDLDPASRVLQIADNLALRGPEAVLKAGYIGDILGEYSPILGLIKGDTRSLDYGSRVPRN